MRKGNCILQLQLGSVGLAHNFHLYSTKNNNLLEAILLLAKLLYNTIGMIPGGGKG